MAKQELIEALQESLRNEPLQSYEDEPNTVKILLQIIKTGNMIWVRKGARTFNDMISVFKDKLAEILDKLHSKYAKLEGIVKEVYKTNAEMLTVREALDNYDSSLQDKYGSLTN